MPSASIEEVEVTYAVRENIMPQALYSLIVNTSSSDDNASPSSTMCQHIFSYENIDLYALHFVCVPILQQQLDFFCLGWCKHRLRTEGTGPHINCGLRGFKTSIVSNHITVQLKVLHYQMMYVKINFHINFIVDQKLNIAIS